MTGHSFTVWPFSCYLEMLQWKRKKKNLDTFIRLLYKSLPFPIPVHLSVHPALSPGQKKESQGTDIGDASVLCPELNLQFILPAFKQKFQHCQKASANCLPVKDKYHSCSLLKKCAFFSHSSNNSCASKLLIDSTGVSAVSKGLGESVKVREGSK